MRKNPYILKLLSVYVFLQNTDIENSFKEYLSSALK